VRNVQLQKISLRLLILSIVASGGLAIAALLAGEFGSLQAKILLSALAVSGASICGMACGAAWDRRRWPGPALGGIALVLLTLIATLIGFWFEPEPIDPWMKCVATGWLFSVAAAHACLLGLTRTDATLAWVRAAAIALGFTLAVGVALPVWTDIAANETPYFRGVGVVGVLMLVASLSLPVVARLRNLPSPAAAAAPSPGSKTALANVMCPRCGQVRSAALGIVECDACGVRFRIEIESS
jgi:hypothetical protein